MQVDSHLPKTPALHRSRSPLHPLLLVLALVVGGSTDPGTSFDRAAELIREAHRGGDFPSDTLLFGEPVRAPYHLSRFYRERNHEPAWIDRRGPSLLIDRVMEVIGRAAEEGLRSADYHDSTLRSVLAGYGRRLDNGPDIAPEEWAGLDLLLTDAFLFYASHLTAGKVNPVDIHPEWSAGRRDVDLAGALRDALAAGDFAGAVSKLLPAHADYHRLKRALAARREMLRDTSRFDFGPLRGLKPGAVSPVIPTLRNVLRSLGDLPDTASDTSSMLDPELREGLRRFQLRHGLKADGLPGSKTIAQLSVPLPRRIREIELTMERWRWLPQQLGERHIIVNIAAFSLWVVERESTVLRQRVVVGRDYRRTPVFAGSMRSVVLAPSWGVPFRLAVEDKLPEVRRDPRYLEREKMKVFVNGPGGEREVDAAAIDWRKVNRSNFRYQFRQAPGPGNALGRAKFLFPNPYDVYLHGTPTRSLFSEDERAFSSGCIRVEDTDALAAWLLRENPRWNPGKIDAAIERWREQTILLDEPIPVYILYWTAWAEDDGSIHFRRDIYGRNAPVDEALAAPPPRAAAPPAPVEEGR